MNNKIKVKEKKTGLIKTASVKKYKNGDIRYCIEGSYYVKSFTDNFEII